MDKVVEMFTRVSAELAVRMVSYKGNQPERELLSAFPAHGDALDFNGAAFSVDAASVASGRDAVDVELGARASSGLSSEMAAGLRLSFSEWSEDNYVVMPAAVYNGNRFTCRAKPHHTPRPQPEDVSPCADPVITHMARLSKEQGPSRLHLIATDMATPAVGVFFPRFRKGLWMLLPVEAGGGYTGVELEESPDRSGATLCLMAPGVRGHLRLENKNTPDRAATLRAGQEIRLRVRTHLFDCADIPALFNLFMDVRSSCAPRGEFHCQIPFSATWDIQERKFNEQNWSLTAGLYATSLTDDGKPNAWSLGWCGGHMVTHPLLFAGQELSRKRVLMNFDALFTYLQRPTGLFYEKFSEGRIQENGFITSPDGDFFKGWSFMRRQGDALYFIIKQFMLMERLTPPIAVEKTWKDGARRHAAALVEIWKRNGQFGQWVDGDTLEVRIGRTACGAIIPAGLALASRYFGAPEFLDVAREAASAFHECHVKKGVTNGGPGDILQAPDSESAFALLESFVVLFEATGDGAWLSRAEDMAAQCASWVVTYDFDFPPHTSFHTLGMRTTGTVWANVQNRHSAPGICTMSGDSLLKLFRHTGKLKYLELIRDIAHAIPQHLSRADRPIPNLEPGWMCERVNISDWENWLGRGEVFRGSCWCEVSNMMTYVEIPGLYVQPDTGLVRAIDHIQAEVIDRNADGIRLRLRNPTAFDAEVRMLLEDSRDTGGVLGQNALLDCPTVRVPAGAAVETVRLMSRNAGAHAERRTFDGLRRQLSLWLVAGPLAVPLGGDPWMSHALDASTVMPASFTRAGTDTPLVTAHADDHALDFESILDHRGTLAQATAFCDLTAPEDGRLTLSYDADWRAVWWVDGREVHSIRRGNGGAVGSMRHRFSVPIAKGHHVLAVRVISGDLGWKLLFHIERWQMALATKENGGNSQTEKAD